MPPGIHKSGINNVGKSSANFESNSVLKFEKLSVRPEPLFLIAKIERTRNQVVSLVSIARNRN